LEDYISAYNSQLTHSHVNLKIEIEATMQTKFTLQFLKKQKKKIYTYLKKYMLMIEEHIKEHMESKQVANVFGNNLKGLRSKMMFLEENHLLQNERMSTVDEMIEGKNLELKDRQGRHDKMFTCLEKQKIDLEKDFQFYNQRYQDTQKNIQELHKIISTLQNSYENILLLQGVTAQTKIGLILSLLEASYQQKQNALNEKTNEKLLLDKNFSHNIMKKYDTADELESKISQLEDIRVMNLVKNTKKVKIVNMSRDIIGSLEKKTNKMITIQIKEKNKIKHIENSYQDNCNEYYLKAGKKRKDILCEQVNDKKKIKIENEKQRKAISIRS